MTGCAIPTYYSATPWAGAAGAVPEAAVVLPPKVEVTLELRLAADVAALLDVGFVLTAVHVPSVIVLVTPCDATTTMEVPT